MFKIIDEKLQNELLENIPKAQLLIFAHYGEAQIFIESLSLIPLLLAQKNESHPLQIFWNGKKSDSTLVFLLITGEGFIKIAETLGPLLSLFFQLNIEISQIKNFGVAGALLKNLQIKNCYNISSVLWQKSHPKFGLDLDFYSYQSLPDKQNLTCITCPERITADEIGQKFLAVAEIVDCELAAIARFATSHSIPWYSVKVISDYAKEINMCNIVMEEAREYSQILWNYYEKNSLLQDALSTSKQEYILEQFVSELHLTESMKRKWQSLRPALFKLEKEKVDQFFLSSNEKLKSSSLRAKEKGQLFLELAIDYLHPKQALLKKHLKELNNKDLSFSWTSDFEKIVMKGEFQNLDGYKRIVHHLEHEKGEKFEKLLKGEIFE